MVDTARKKTAAHGASVTHGASDAVVQPLRNRIPNLLPAQAEALRAFFAAPQYWALRGGGTLYFAPGTPGTPLATFMLEGDGVRLALDLEANDSGYTDDGLHWSDYTGRSRLLAWSLAHETQLMRLSDGLGVSLIPVDAPMDTPIEEAPDDAVIDAPDATRAPEHLWLNFSIDSADIDASASASHRGKLRLPFDWMPRLLDRAEQPYVDDPLPALGRWRDWPVPVVVQLAGPDLSGADWRTLRPGDVIVVGTRSRPPRVSAEAAGFAWPLAAAAQGWRVEGAAQSIPSAYRESPAMNHNEASAATPAGAGADSDDDSGARSLPVKLTFEIGQLEMNVGELSTLQPGYVFALPAHLEGANVTIRANSRVSGRGEVVAVGETLGVRLLSWS